MSNPWILIEDLHLARGGRPVLQGINAAISAPAVGLVGANGAGKSTLIGALLGILRPSRGRIRVLGHDVPARARAVRTLSGVMAEQAGVYPGGSGVDAVTFAGMLSGLAYRAALRRAHQALDALDVGEERYRPTRSYSTGMRQRCKLAMSLVHNPQILILDEPTVGLDPPGRAQLLALIRDLRDEGRRILLSTHILQDAQMVCDELLLLEAGVVSFCGPLSTLVSSGTSQLTAEGAGIGPAFADRLVRAGLQVAGLQEGRITFTTRGDHDLEIFWKSAHEDGVEVRRLGHEVATLEDAVVHMMERANDAQ